MKDTITINDFFEIAKETDLKDLLDKSLHEPDPEKVQKQLQNFADQNPEVKPKNDPENKNDRSSY